MLTTVSLLASSEAGAAAEHNPLLPEPAEIVVGLVAFAILFFFLSAKVFPVFERLARERAHAIEGGMEQAAATQAEAQALLEQYQESLREARTEAAKIRTEAQAERASIIEAAREEAREAAAQEVARSRAQLEADIATTRAALMAEVGTIAVDLASRVVGENLADEKVTKRTVDRFIKGLEEMTPANAVTESKAGR